MVIKWDSSSSLEIMHDVDEPNLNFLHQPI